MSDQTISIETRHPEDNEFNQIASTRLFGFWVYIMSDCVLFAVLFATYAVLGRNYAGGPSGKEIFDLRGVMAETFCLLASSFSYGLAVLAMNRGKRVEVLTWLAVTFVLGASFVGLEISEFSRLVAVGNGPTRSAFLSSFFTLVGTHGAHVSIGLLWMAVLMVKVLRRGLTAATSTKILLLSLFWHFLDIVWICIFTLVYLLGVL